LAFPNNKSINTIPCEVADGFHVAATVAPELGLPVFGSRFWPLSELATGMLVPETAMDEDDLAASAEHDVRRAR
jgi:hypothetical protein